MTIINKADNRTFITSLRNPSSITCVTIRETLSTKANNKMHGNRLLHTNFAKLNSLKYKCTVHALDSIPKNTATTLYRYGTHIRFTFLNNTQVTGNTERYRVLFIKLIRFNLPVECMAVTIKLDMFAKRLKRRVNLQNAIVLSGTVFNQSFNTYPVSVSKGIVHIESNMKDNLMALTNMLNSVVYS